MSQTQKYSTSQVGFVGTNYLSYCDSLENFPSIVGGLLEKLKNFGIISCINIRSIPGLNLASLEELDFQIVTVLRVFHLWWMECWINSKYLEFTIVLCSQAIQCSGFPLLNIYLFLEHINISHCYSLERFPPLMDEFLDNLQVLRVHHCCKLKSFEGSHCYILSQPKNFSTHGGWSLRLLAELKYLNVSYCSQLRIFHPSSWSLSHTTWSFALW